MVSPVVWPYQTIRITKPVEIISTTILSRTVSTVCLVSIVGVSVLSLRAVQSESSIAGISTNAVSYPSWRAVCGGESTVIVSWSPDRTSGTNAP